MAPETPLLCNAWDKGKLLFQPCLKLISGSCNSKEKGFHWILAIMGVHKWTAGKLEAYTALWCKTLGTEETLASTFLCRNLPQLGQYPTATGEPRFPIPSTVTMQFLGSDLDKVQCFMQLSKGRRERSQCCSDQGQPIWLISAQTNKQSLLCNLTW